MGGQILASSSFLSSIKNDGLVESPTHDSQHPIPGGNGTPLVHNLGRGDGHVPRARSVSVPRGWISLSCIVGADRTKQDQLTVESDRPSASRRRRQPAWWRKCRVVSSLSLSPIGWVPKPAQLKLHNRLGESIHPHPRATPHSAEPTSLFSGAACAWGQRNGAEADAGTLGSTRQVGTRHPQTSARQPDCLGLKLVAVGLRYPYGPANGTAGAVRTRAHQSRPAQQRKWL